MGRRSADPWLTRTLCAALVCATGTAAARSPHPVVVPNGSTINGVAEGVTPLRSEQRLALDGHVSVGIHNGEVLLQAVDLEIPGKGMDLEFRRVYRSQVTYPGPLGLNWSHGFDQHVYVVGTTLVHSDGSRLAVDTYVPASGGLYRCTTPAQYRKAQLIGAQWVIRDRHGKEWRFRAIDGSAAEGRLHAVTDRFGNQVSMAYDSAGRLQTITDTVGRNLQIGYGSGGFISTLTDFAGRTWTYAYANGDLHSVTTPPILGTPQNPETGTSNDFPQGRTTTYAYTAQPTSSIEHNLYSVVRPNEHQAGTPSIVIDYDGDHVESAAAGGTNASGVPAGGVFEFAYSASSQSGEAAETLVTNPRGFSTAYGFDVAGHVLRIEEFTAGLRPSDPSSFVTTVLVNQHGEVIERHSAGGRVAQRAFDDANPDQFRRGNLLTETRLPAPNAPGGAGPVSVTYNWDPLYNEPVGDLNGTTGTLDYQEAAAAQNGVLALAATWGIDVSGITFGLGDVNGDGSVLQIGGRQIRTVTPTITRGVATPVTITQTFTFDGAGRPVTSASGEGVLEVHEYESDANGGGLKKIIRDADPTQHPSNSGTGNWAKPSSIAHVEATTELLRDSVGNVVQRTNPRGVATYFIHNALGETVLTVRGFATAAWLDGDLAALNAAGYWNLVQPALLTYHTYDANGNEVRTDVEVRNAGLAGNGWHTTERTFDIRDQQIEQREEIDAGTVAVTRWARSPKGQIVQTIFPEGNFDVAELDERDLVLSVTRGASDPSSSATVRFDYDADRNVVREDGPDDLDDDGEPDAKLSIYDGHGNVLDTISPVGTLHHRIYGANGYLLAVQAWGTPGGPSPNGNDTSQNVLLAESAFSYDEIGRMYQQSRHNFDLGTASNLPFAITDEWLATRYAYDRDKNIVAIVEPSGNVSTRTFDGLGRIVSRSDSLGNQETSVYDAGDNRTFVRSTEVNPLNGSLAENLDEYSTYDCLGRLVRTVDAAGRATYFAHDSLDNRVGEADANGPIVGPDPLGIFPGSVNAAGNTRRWIHDGLGNVVRAVTDLRQNGVGSGSVDLLAASFDPAVDPPPSELDLLANPDGMLSSDIVHDRNGNALEVISDTGKHLTHEYNDQDFMTSKRFEDGTSFATTYWKDGSVRAHALYDGDGGLVRMISSTYDGASRLVRRDVTLPGGSRFEGTRVKTYQYDGRGYVTRMTDDNGSGIDPNYRSSTVTRSYDAAGRMIMDDQNGDKVYRDLTAAGHAREVHYPSGRRLTYSYDSLGRLAQVDENTGAAVAHYDYYGPGRIARIELGNGTAIGFETPFPSSNDVTGYDASGFPRQVEHRGPVGQTLSWFSHVFDRVGQRANELRQLASGITTRDDVVYDGAGRLRTLDRDNFNGVVRRSSNYTFDGDSVMNSIQLTAAGQAPSQYAMGITATTGYSSIAGAAIQQDLAGNRILDHWFLYFFDAEDRLVRIALRYPGDAEGPTVMRYSYDALGRRIEKSVAEDFGPPWATRTRFVHDRDHVIEERDAAGALLADYVIGGEIDERLQMRRATGSGGFATYFYLFNTLGSVVALTNAAGDVVERYGYDPFGAPIFLDGAGLPVFDVQGKLVLQSQYGNPYLFTAREYDYETALVKSLLSTMYGYFQESDAPTGQYFFRRRYVDPAEQRFISRDPLALVNNTAASPTSVVGRILSDGYVEGPYAYAGNNGVNKTDPLGLSVQWVARGNQHQKWWALLNCAGEMLQKTPRTGLSPPPIPGGAAAGGAGGAVGGVVRGAVWTTVVTSVFQFLPYLFGSDSQDCHVSRLSGAAVTSLTSALGVYSDKDCESATRMALNGTNDASECLGEPIRPAPGTTGSAGEPSGPRPGGGDPPEGGRTGPGGNGVGPTRPVVTESVVRLTPEAPEGWVQVPGPCLPGEVTIIHFQQLAPAGNGTIVTVPGGGDGEEDK